MANLTSELIYGFSESFLRPGFDNAQPIPEFHREIWELACSEIPKVAIAAPRGHGKSSAVSFTFVLAAALFGFKKHILMVSETETQAIGFLNDLKVALRENEELINMFGIDQKFLKDTESDVVVKCSRGIFRIVVKGAEQKVRGLKWRNRRPDLIIVDDAEGDEQVMNRERRLKFKNWFYNALLPCGSDNCVVRVVGTVMHMDSLLENLLNNPNWKTVRYSAHNNDYTQILWRERFSRSRLMQIRADYQHNNNLEGYAQEYLNIAIDDSSAMFKKDYFLSMEMSDHQRKKIYYLSADLAVSTEKYADRSAMIVAGVDEDNKIYIVDMVVGRFDSLEICQHLLRLYALHDCSALFMEKGVIDRAIGPLLREQMFKSNVFMNVVTQPSNKNKTERAKSIHGRMKMGGVKFDKESDWYPDLENEMTTFPKAKRDDIVDAMSLLGLNLQIIATNPSKEQIDEEQYQEEWSSNSKNNGRCVSTGY